MKNLTSQNSWSPTMCVNGKFLNFLKHNSLYENPSAHVFQSCQKKSMNNKMWWKNDTKHDSVQKCNMVKKTIILICTNSQSNKDFPKKKNTKEECRKLRKKMETNRWLSWMHATKQLQVRNHGTLEQNRKKTCENPQNDVTTKSKAHWDSMVCCSYHNWNTQHDTNASTSKTWTNWPRSDDWSFDAPNDRYPNN